MLQLEDDRCPDLCFFRGIRNAAWSGVWVLSAWLSSTFAVGGAGAAQHGHGGFGLVAGYGLAGLVVASPLLALGGDRMSDSRLTEGMAFISGALIVIVAAEVIGYELSDDGIDWARELE